MFKFFIVVLSSLLSIRAYTQQVTFQSVMQNTEKHFEAGKAIGYLIPACFKRFDSIVALLYSDATKTSSHLSEIQLLNLNNQKIIKNYKLSTKIDPSLNVDILYNTTGLWILYNKSLYKLGENGELSKVISKLPYKYIEGIGGDKIVFYDLLTRHPFDDNSKLKLQIYNTRNRRLGRLKEFDFKGYSVTNIINKWVTGFNNNIIVVDPFNMQLNFLDDQYVESKTIKLNQLLKYENKYYIVEQMDLQKRNEDSLLLAARKKLKKPDEYEINSDYYSKNEKVKRFQLLRDSTNYIEKVFHYNDSTLIVSVYRAGYQLNFRDVYFYDLKHNKIVYSFLKWRTSRKENIEDVAAYFPIDLINSNLATPFFYKDYAYGEILWCGDLESYKGSKEEVAKKELKCSLKNNWNWALGIYSYR